MFERRDPAAAERYAVLRLNATHVQTRVTHGVGVIALSTKRGKAPSPCPLLPPTLYEVSPRYSGDYFCFSRAATWFVPQAMCATSAPDSGITCSG